jgi:protein-S-isoprenylcysteine O-methyltransferase Ste14
MISDKLSGRALVLDLIERAVIAIFFSAMAWSFLVSWQQTGNIVSLILLLSESSVVLFIVIRRSTGDVSVRPIDWLVAVLGTTAPLLVRPTGGGDALASLYICVPLMLTGLALQIAAKLTLRRSFGVVAANRGVKVTGPYRLVRHPMYAGYLMTQLAFLLINPSAWNLAVYSFATALQIGRIMAEEQVLGSDPSYRAFAAVVPSRLVPRVF